MPSPRSPFIWQGNTGEAMTPQQVERRRLAAALMQQQASATTPVASPFAGLNRALQGYISGRDERRADSAEASGMAGARGMWDHLSGILGGGAPAAPGQAPLGAAPSGGDPAAPPSGDVAGYVRSGLVSRGLPEHVADAFLINFQDESGLNPGINEAAPTVPGSRGGFGLYQLTGPRRREYEAFAAQRGVDPSDIDAQLDFMMQELGGSEARAGQSILSAPDTPTAAAAILNDFLRPAEEHRRSREARYLGGGGTYTPPSQQNVSAIGGALGDPWFAQQYGQVANALMGQQMNMQNAVFQQDLQQQDPLYQANLAAATAPQPSPTAERNAFAVAGGLQPGTPEYNHYILTGELPAPTAPPEAPQTQTFWDAETGQQYRAQWNPQTQTWDRVGGVAAPDPGVNVTTNVMGEGFNERAGDLTARRFNDLAVQGQGAQQRLGRLESLAGILENTPTGAAASWTQLAGEYGIPMEGLDNIQAAQAIINQLVPEQRPAGSGPMSDADLALFKQSVPRLINQPGGNQVILDTMRAIATYDLQLGQIASQALLGDITPQQAQEQINALGDPMENYRRYRSGGGTGGTTDTETTPPIRRRWNPETGMLE